MARWKKERDAETARLETAVAAAKSTKNPFAGCGTERGLRIWRIEKFEAAAWPEERYGEFYTGSHPVLIYCDFLLPQVVVMSCQVKISLRSTTSPSNLACSSLPRY